MSVATSQEKTRPDLRDLAQQRTVIDRLRLTFALHSVGKTGHKQNFTMSPGSGIPCCTNRRLRAGCVLLMILC